MNGILHISKIEGNVKKSISGTIELGVRLAVGTSTSKDCLGVKEGFTGKSERKLIITDKNIYIHLPKTGGTFVLRSMEVLARIETMPPLYKPLFYLLLILNRFTFFRNSLLSHYSISIIWRTWWKRDLPLQKFRRYGKDHNICTDIPSSHSGKQIFSCIRDVTTYYQSWYKYRSSTHFAGESLKKIMWSCPELAENYPDNDPEKLTFIDFWNYVTRYLDDMPRHMGWYSFLFLRFYHKNAERVIKMDPEDYREYVLSGEYKNDLFPAVFLRTEHLNEDLYKFLLSQGHRRFHAELIRYSQKINNTVSSENLTYTAEQKEKLMREDLLIVEVYKEVEKNPLQPLSR